MPLLLPNLDDRTWADLVDEGRALIPVYGPEWTDHNFHDPGITLIELLAFIAEMDIYQLNQISDRERLKFLSLVGIAPQPPAAAQAVLNLGLATGAAPRELPAGLEFVGADPDGIATRFRTLDAITLAPGSLAVLQSRDGAGFQNLTPAWRRGGVLRPFGSSPQPGAAFYLGLTAALPVDVPVRMELTTFADRDSDPRERQRLIDQAREIEEHCRPPLWENPCRTASRDRAALPPPQGAAPQLPRHHGVRTVWEFLALVGGDHEWVRLDPAKGQVEDDTRAFTLNGAVTFRVPQAMVADTLGAVPATYYYLRCRIEAGRHDAVPTLQDVAFNGVRAQQAVPSGGSFVIDPKAAVVDAPEGPPNPGDWTTLRLELDERSIIQRLTFGGGAATDPRFLVVDYKAPSSPSPGRLSLEAALVGVGNGFPHQQVSLPAPPIERSSVEVFTLEGDVWRAWEIRTDFDASTRIDLHAVLDPTTGIVTFGDGEKGRVPPELRTPATGPCRRCLIFATYSATHAQLGNLAAGTINKLADSPHNRAIAYDDAAVPDGFSALKSNIGPVTNPLRASGGAAAETVAHAAGRADQLVEDSGRAVTLADYERLALRTPGTRIARVTARANLHPSFPCFEAPGMVALIVLPYLPDGRPVPTPGLLSAVKSYLGRRRVIGTRVEVVGPTYLEVAIHAEVQSKAGTDKAKLAQAVVTALNGFLDPLRGGPDESGWPFGRDVYRSEIMRVIDEVAGADYVVSLELRAGGGPPQCGNVCLGPTWLVAAGTHQIEVL